MKLLFTTHHDNLIKVPKDEQVLNFGSDPFEEESEVSCWPLVCASAKKSSHKGLNIDKLTTRPVIRTGEKKEESVGWLSWLLGIDLSYYTEDVPDEEEEEEQVDAVDSDDSTDEAGDDSDETDDVLKKYMDEDFDDIGPIEQLSDEELHWYSVKLLDDEDWFSVDLLRGDYDSADGRDWWEVDPLGGALPSSWLGVNMFGLSGGRYWYEVSWLGGEAEETQLVCADIDHDTRAWYEVSWLGFCHDGVRRWYEVDLLGNPVVDQGFVDEDDEEEEGDISAFGVDLLGNYYYSLDNRNWYDIDLYREPITPELEEEDEEMDQDSGFQSIEVGNEEEKKENLETPVAKKQEEKKVKVEKPVKVTEKPKEPKEEKKEKKPEPAEPKKTTIKTVKDEKPLKVTETPKPHKVDKKVKEPEPTASPKKEPKPSATPKKESEPTVTPKTKKTTTTKAPQPKPPKEIKEQKVVQINIEKKGPKEPTEEEKAKMAKVPIPPQKATKKQESKPNTDPSSDTKKLVAENNNVVAFICEYKLPLLGLLLCLTIQP